MCSLLDQQRKYLSGNLILVGLMGSGKTTMGRSLAKHLNNTFIDSDEEIVKRTGVTIPHVFDVEGEAGFRARESAVIAEVVQRENTVLATGGGAVLSEQNRDVLSKNGVVIYIKASVHDLWQRTRHDRNRPLLRTSDPYAKLTELFQQRDPLYQSIADIVVMSGKRSAHALMLHVVDEFSVLKNKMLSNVGDM